MSDETIDPESDDRVDDQLDMKYEESEYYEYVPVNGVRGGIQARGGAKFEFLLDHSTRPNRSVFNLNEEGGIEDVANEEFDSDMTRKVHFAIDISPENAFSIGSFMMSEVIGVSEDEIRTAIENHFEDRFEDEG